jgi:hypothetical protein
MMKDDGSKKGRVGAGTRGGAGPGQAGADRDKYDESKANKRTLYFKVSVRKIIFMGNK